MNNIMTKESINEFSVVGVLNEMKLIEGTSNKSNDQYVGLDIQIKVDQPIGDKVEENVIPVKLFSSRHKKDGNLNANYDRIKGYADKLQSLGSVDNPKDASRVNVVAKIAENAFAGKDGRIINTWQLSTNFINDARNSDEEGATFVVTGVVVKKLQELDREGNETGRLIVKLDIIGYNGTSNVIDFYASGSAADHIDRNWEQGDTVKAAGVIAMTKKVIKIEEEMGFGEALVKERTESRRELIITKGSQAGLSEDESYDSDDIKVSLDKRKAYLTSLEENAKNKSSAAPAKKSSDGFGF